jgi:3-phosphoinositide dependent protein kinase-1
MHLKLTDFGTAKEMTAADSANPKRRGSFVGTAEYVCPEILRDQIPTIAADMWSFGCLVYQMLVGKVPFRGNSEYLTFQKILKGQLKWPEDMDPVAQDLIQKLLVVDPTRRLGATLDGYAALRAHPFFDGIDFATLFDQFVPPRPAPSIIVPDEPDVYEYKDEVDDDDPACDGECSESETAHASDEEFRSKMDQLAEEEAARAQAEAAEDGEAREAPEEAADFVAPLPHGPTVAERTAAVHKTSTDGQYSNSVWSRFLQRDERIVYTGLIIKRRALFARKRQLILTDTPRLFYVDPDHMEMKKEVAWSDKLWAEVVDDMTFYIHVPNRDYYMRGLSSSAYCWVNEINKYGAHTAIQGCARLTWS